MFHTFLLDNGISAHCPRRNGYANDAAGTTGKDHGRSG